MKKVTGTNARARCKLQPQSMRTEPYYVSHNQVTKDEPRPGWYWRRAARLNGRLLSVPHGPYLQQCEAASASQRD
ncbi:hypothetical protein [Cupriavidus basilensis]|nr:hypothetical protein [Cupriavidus basilensis]